MHHRFLALLLIGIAFVEAASASTIINLKCNVQSTYRFSTGTVERDEGLALVKIEETEPHVSIWISSDIQTVSEISVSSVPGGSPTRDWVGINSSTDSKWDVTREMTSKTADGETLNSRIVIDRISGTLIINKRFTTDKGWTMTSISGSCEKPSGQKKF